MRHLIYIAIQLISLAVLVCAFVLKIEWMRAPGVAYCWGIIILSAILMLFFLFTDVKDWEEHARNIDMRINIALRGLFFSFEVVTVVYSDNVFIGSLLLFFGGAFIVLTDNGFSNED